MATYVHELTFYPQNYATLPRRILVAVPNYCKHGHYICIRNFSKKRGLGIRSIPPNNRIVKRRTSTALHIFGLTITNCNGDTLRSRYGDWPACTAFCIRPHSFSDLASQIPPASGSVCVASFDPNHLLGILSKRNF
jgi:hypothetical protein